MPLPALIDEHAPLRFADPIGWATLSLAAGYAAVLLGVLPQRPRVVWLVPLVWFVLAVQRARNAPLFAVTAVIALADMLPHSRLAQWLQRRDLLASRRRERAVVGHRWAWLLPLAVLAAMAMVQISGVSPPTLGCGWAQFDAARWPMELRPQLEEINRLEPDGTPVFNDLNFGGFLIYYTPKLRVFVDDRCSLYGGDFLTAYDYARRNDPAAIERWQRQYGFRFALVERGGRFDRFLAESGPWTRVASTPAATLYRRSLGDSPPVQ